MGRTLIAVASVAAAACLGACAGGEDGSPTSAVPDAPSPSSSSGQGLDQNRSQAKESGALADLEPEEKQAAQAVTDFYAILADDAAGDDPDEAAIDSEAFCSLLSEGAQEQTVEYAKASAGIARKWDCESAVELLAIRAKRFGGLSPARRVRVIGVNARGDRASATVRMGGGSVTSLPLVREGDEWKLAATADSAGR